MKSDNEIERDVRDELKWDTDLDADDIAVSVKDGVVTLAGFAHSYADRLEAEMATKRVVGVRLSRMTLRFGCHRSISAPILILHETRSPR